MVRHVAAALLAVAATLGAQGPGPGGGASGTGAEGTTSRATRPEPAGLDSLLAANAHPLRVEDGRLRGPGARLLAGAARGTRFFAMGEAAHLRAALPPFATALFRLLREEEGYRYMALEEGPEIARRLSRAGRRGGRDSVMAVARRYPTAFHMYTVEELHMMGDVAAEAGGSAGPPGPIWGLNRVYAAWHVLERLRELSGGADAPRVLRGLADSARAHEEERFARDVRWLVEGLGPEDLDRLEAALGPERGSEAARLLEQLGISRRTFAPYHREDAGPADFYRSARLREQNMKELFTRRYREAGRAGDRAPRVLVKMGLYHVSRGRKMVGEVYTVGNFLSELATFEDGESFHLAVVADAPETREIPLARPFLEAAPDGEATLLDFRPLHPLLGSGEVEGAGAPQRRLMLDYDAMVVLPDTGPATVEPLRTPNFHLSPGG